MFKLISCLTTILLVLFPSIPLHGTGRPPVVIPLELNEDGLPIVKVLLHDKGRPGSVRAFRFSLDTGAGITLVGPRVPARFIQPDGSTVRVLDAEGGQAEFPRGFLKRIEVGGMVRDDIAVACRDLESTWGRLQDRPVDGILGMNFLGGVRFTLDCPNRKIILWDSPAWAVSGSSLGYDVDRVPYVVASNGSQSIPCKVDTGALGGFWLPATSHGERDRGKVLGQGILGATQSHDLATLKEISLDAVRWRNVEATLEDRADTGGMGMAIFSPVRVHLDFVANRLAFEAPENGELPVSRTGCSTLPIAWDREVQPAFLKVIAVRPGSAMEHAGLLPGDCLVRVGDLTGNQLTRKRVLGVANSGIPHSWIVRRDGILVRLEFPAAGSRSMAPKAFGP